MGSEGRRPITLGPVRLPICHVLHESGPPHPHTDRGGVVGAEVAGGPEVTRARTMDGDSLLCAGWPWGAGRGWGAHRSSYCLRCIRWMMSLQSLKTRRMFSVSTAHVKCG